MPFRLTFILLIALSTTAAQPQALWTMPEAVAEAGFSIDQSVPDCPQTASCYSIHPPADPVPMAIEGSVMQNLPLPIAIRSFNSQAGCEHRAQPPTALHCSGYASMTPEKSRLTGQWSVKRRSKPRFGRNLKSSFA